MEKTKLNYLIDVGLALSFLGSFATGLVKFQGLLPFLGLSYSSIPMRQISRIHDWSGIVMGILVILHLFLHRKWIAAMTKNILGIK